jgi:acyl transferase domain-containing protein/NADPH:quinone reductase-like Zn-dependent oxidoreductase/acyl carrier protein
MIAMSESRQEPIAIVGIGCRFPGGADSAAAFWDLLKDGTDAIVEVPKDRWNVDEFYDPHPETPGKMYVRAGGFLREKIDEFDAAFFGMSPREASYLDPQQRLLLEVAWEAMEDAGLVVEQLAGSKTGVYIGAFMLDNLLTQLSPLNRNSIGAHSQLGATMNNLANRLSYVFDFRGPSITMDTACSSSLVAFHQACQALWHGECSLALAGGVNVMLRPEGPIAGCKGGFLAPDGRCKSFDARADGYGRGEGAGIVILKPLLAALQDGDEIYALVRATGVNQDGRTNGITAPNPEAQEALVRQVCADGEVSPSQIRYIEAHGTGTALGDPIEAAALGAAIGRYRAPDDPCVVGSVKANIGHLEAAAGVAGIIKASLCLKHNSVPPVANLETPNPKIAFAELGLRLPRGTEPMSAGPDATCVAINSFGYGGTNAHAILQEAMPAAEPGAEGARDVHLLPISARSRPALVELAKAYHQLLAAGHATSLRDICYSAALRRSHHDHRLAVIAGSGEAMDRQLQSFVENLDAEGVAVGTCGTRDQRPVFVFTGMGPQWWAMGRELLRAEPVFRRVAEECDAIFQRLAGWSILVEMQADEASSRMSETHIAQPANFIVQAALAALWRDRGVEPAAIVGHSVGEVSAAFVSGILDLEDAVRVSYHRSRIQKKAAGLGGMLAVGLTEATAEPLLAKFHGDVSLAAVNAPAAITLAGDMESLRAIAAELEAEGVFNRFLQVEVAYHSPYMDPLQAELVEALADLRVKPPAIPVYSTVTGQRVDGHAYDAAYWSRNIREPVYFARAMEALIRDGHRAFVEVGPHPVLSTSIKGCLSQHRVDGIAVASLRRGRSEASAFAEALANLYVAGCPIDWRAFHGGDGRYVRLPTNPWQRERYWHEAEEAYLDRVGSAEHALLGRRVNAPNPSWQSTLSSYVLPYLADHRVEDMIVLPGTAYVELGRAAHYAMNGRTQCVLEELEFYKALVIDKFEQPLLRVTCEDATYTVHSRRGEGNSWTLHAQGRISLIAPGMPARVMLTEIQARCSDAVSHEHHYEDMRRRGLQYGRHFQGVRELWRRPDCEEVLARIEDTELLMQDQHRDGLHPALLDASLQSLFATIADEDDANLYLPVGIRQVRVYEPLGGKLWCHTRKTRHANGLVEGDATVCNDVGEVLAEIRGLQAKMLTKKERDDLKDLDQWLYQFVWQSAPQERSEGGGNWLIFMDRNGVGERLVAELETAGAAQIIRVLPAATFRRKGACDYRIRPNEKQDMRRLLADAIRGGLRGVVYLWGLDSDEAADAVGIAKVVSGLNLIQSLGELQAADPARVSFVTCQAQAVDPRRYELSLAQVPLVGLVRAAISERPELGLRLIDIDGGAGTLSCLAGEILSISAEEEIAIRGVDRYVHRLVRKPAREMTAEAAENPWPAQGVSLPIADRSESATGASGRRGGQDSPSDDLATQEVEVELRFAPVGRGVVPAGALPADPVVAGDIATWVGPEAAGTVTRIGTRVDKLQVGDAVLVDLQGDTGPRVTRPQRHVFRLSGRSGAIGMDHDALLPTFVSAYYALHHVARLQKGERVLVHGAASPLGLAAIQVARWLEAAPYVTAADAEEGAQLRALGVEHVFDCASLEFVDRIVEHSEGRRIDVVFNMLPGEVAAKTFALLAPFGRFVNMLRGRQPVATVPLQPNQCVTDVDVHHVMRDRPEVFGQLLAEVLAGFDAEDLSPLPRQVFGAAESVNTAGAPAYSSQPFTAVVRSFDGVQPGASSSELMPKGQVRVDGTYLITGGFGGFGLELAKWLTSQGARHLALVGRRGAGRAQAQQTIEKLRRGGVRVLTIAADIAEESGVQRVMAEITSAGPPLRGVFHTAAVLDDALIQHLAPRQVENVMRPKALGAWHLHRHTLDAPLDHFVLFSSIGSLLGNPGQATYVAANAFLDALAHFRRSRDLPALSINWGALAQVGMAADHPEAEQYLGSVGVGFFTPRQAMKIFRRVLEWNPVELCTAIMDWNVWGATYPAWIASPRFRHLLTAEDRAAAGEHGTSAGAQEFNPEERKTMVAAILVESVAAVLRMAPEKLDHTLSLFSMGVDSMMAMELQGAIEKKIGVKLSALELMNGNSFAQLIQQVGHLATEKAHAAITVMATSPTAASNGRNGRPHAGGLQGLLDLADVGQTAALLRNLSDEEVVQALDQLQVMAETAL